MAIITISIQDDIEEKFRMQVYQLYGKKKGSIGKAVTEAIQEWSKKKAYLDTCMELLQKGVDAGRMKYKTRDELYVRS